MTEVWKSLNGLIRNGDFYEVSNLGNVRSIDKVDTLGRFRKGQILKLVSDKDGYLMVSLWLNNKGYNEKVHRLVALAFIDNENNKPQVNHKDGNKTNNKTDNLEWATSRENIHHGIENELYSKKRMISEEDVIKMIEMYNTGNYKQVDLCKIFNLSKQAVNGYIKGRRKINNKPS